MNASFTDAQIALRDQVRAYLEEAHPATLLRAQAEGNANASAIWQGFVEMGLPGLLVPEDHGGMGLSLLEGALIGVELGRALVSGPLADTALVAAPWIAKERAGRAVPAPPSQIRTESATPAVVQINDGGSGGGGTPHPALLQNVAAGTATIAVAHPINPWIAHLDHATHLLTAAGLQTPPKATPLPSADTLRHLAAPLPDAPADDHLLNLAALAAAAQLLGTAERMLAMATDYAKLRKQFGQPIGGFQAVKHLLANTAIRNEFATPVLWRAAVSLQEQHPHAPIHVSHAKLAATDAALLAAETAIQVHGAMGYTYEVDLHFWMKRAWALAGAWGDRNFHQHRLHQAVLGGTVPLGPGATFASEDHHA
jgi:hypothetical protein